MNKGIYLDKQTGKWYINTRVNGKRCTIRGYRTKHEADEDYDRAVQEWISTHNFVGYSGEYETIRNEFFNYRSKRVSHETLKKDKHYMKFFDIRFVNNTLDMIFNKHRLKIIYSQVEKETGVVPYRLTTVFNSFSEFCFLNGYISSDMYQNVRVIFIPPKVNRHSESKKRYITKEERQKLLDVIDHDDKDYVIFSLFVEVGMRISEFLGLDVSSYNKSEESLTVKQQLLVNGTITTQLKTSNSYRKVFLTHENALLINEYILNNNLFNGRLFRLSHTEFRRKLNKYEQLANIPNYSAHEFRHSKAVDLSKVCITNNDVVICANYLGHSVTIFQNTYCNHFKDNDMKTLLSKL